MKPIVTGGRLAWIFASILWAAAPLLADYTVSGRFLYEDREFDENGFTGIVTPRPIRYADVRIMAGILLLKTGATREDGTFSVTVPGTPDQAITAVCVTSSSATPGLLVDARVANYDYSFGDYYSMATPAKIAPSPFAVDMGTTLAVADRDTGKIFNIWDVIIDGMQFVASDQAAGSLPAVRLTVLWNLTHPRIGSFYEADADRFLYVGSISAYDDTVISHEFGHFMDDAYSKSDSPAGQHFIGDSNQDIRLSWAEGLATFLGSSIRQFKGYARPELYVNTDGDILSFSYDIESLSGTSPIASKVGSTNEIAVTAALWDTTDGINTNDSTPGEDDDPLQRPFQDVWKVLTLYMPGVTRPGLSIETFWDGWFSPAVRNGDLDKMQAVFSSVNGIEFVADSFEPDNTVSTAPVAAITRLPALGSAAHVVINEMEMGSVDTAELYNAGSTAINLQGWTVSASATEYPTAVFTLPSYILAPGAFVILSEAAGIDSNTVLYFANNISWDNGKPGACVLSDASGAVVDFVRWGGSSLPTPAGTIFTGPDPAAPPRGKTLGRNLASADTDSGSDWTAQLSTLGTFNAGGGERHHTYYGIGDVDYTAFIAVAGNGYLIETLNLLSGADTTVEIIAKDGTSVLATNDDFGATRASRLAWTAPASGKYYIRVRRYDSPANFAQYGSYDLRIIESATAFGLALPSVLTVSQPGQGGQYQRIADALRAASNGDTVQILDSAIYAENLSVFGKSLTLTASRGKNPILAPGSSPTSAVLNISGAKSFRIEGITISGGARGLRLSGTGTIINTIVTGASDPSGNSDGIQIVGTGSFARIVHCTVANNGRFGVSLASGASGQIVNSILWGNAGLDLDFENTQSTFTVSNSLVGRGLSLSGGNIGSDPLFVNAPQGDFHLKPTSPAIDKGDPSDPDLPGDDLDGIPRVLDGRRSGIPIPDMGAFEYMAPGSLTETVFMPQVAIGGTNPAYRTTLVGVNANNAATLLQVALTRSDGTPFPAALLNASPSSLAPQPGSSEAASNLMEAGGSFYLSIPPMGMTRLETSATANTVAGYAIVNSSLKLGGSALLQTVNGTSIVSEAGVGFSKPTKHFTIYIDNLNFAFSGYAVMNPGTSPATLTLTLRDRNGLILDTKSPAPLLPGHHFAEFAVERFVSTAPAGFEGSIEFVSDQEVAAVAIRCDNPGREVFSTIPVLADEASSSLYFPQIADGGGYRANLIFINAGEVDTTAKLEFFDSDGRPLPIPIGGGARTSYEMPVRAKGVARIITDGTSSGLAVGWVRVTAAAAIGGSSILQTLTGTRIRSEAGVAASPSTQHFAVYVDSLGYTESGLAICNPNSVSINITLRLRDTFGREAGTTSLTLAPLGHIARFFTQWFPRGFEEFEGTLEVIASGSVSAIALRQDNYEANVLATLPVVIVP